MPLYLSPYIGQGTRDNPFRPSGADQSGASAIDLRIDCTRADGGGLRFALLWLPLGSSSPTGAIKLADDHGETVSTLIKNAANTRFGLDFSKDLTIQDLVETILLRPDNGHWHRLRPNRGRVEAWLGSGTGKRRWVDFPVLAGGATALDNFNRADENPLAGNWTSVSANPFRLIGNQAYGSGAGSGETYAYWNANTFSDDQFSQIQIVTANEALGVTVRGSGASTDYYAVQDFTGANLFKYVSGAYTSLDQQSYAWSTNDYIRLAASGSTLTVYGDASNPPTTQIAQATDTTFASGKVGIYDWFGNAILDNWSGGDLSSQFAQSTSGALASSGAIVKQSRIIPVGSLAISGSLVKRGIKTLTSAVAPAGSLVRQARKLIAGVMAGSGMLTSARAFLKAISGGLGMAGSLTRRSGRNVAGSAVSSGTISRRIGRGVSGAMVIMEPSRSSPSS